MRKQIEDCLATRKIKKEDKEVTVKEKQKGK